jgi:drug/metabolite transporter (DMT)-like permease
MIWFFVAIIAPFLYAITNYIDKMLLDKYFKNNGAGTILLFSALVSLFALPFLFLMDPTILDISGKNILILLIVGVLNILVLFCYLIALKDEEASIVVVFYQLVPVFGAVLGYFFLGEILTKIQIIAMAIIILGTTIIAFEVDSDNKFKLRKKTILPMLAAALFWAIESVLFKSAALEEDLWKSLFWEHVALVLVGALIFMFVKTYRKSFLLAIKNNSRSILSFNFANETVYILGNVASGAAYLLAPVGLVLLTESFQPIFVLAIGLFLTFFFPRVTTEKVRARNVWQKVIAILITGIGTYLLLVS